MEDLEILRNLAHQSVDNIINDFDRKYAEKIWHKLPDMPRQSGPYLIAVYLEDWEHHAIDYAFYDKEGGWRDYSGRPYDEKTKIVAWQERILPDWLKDMLVEI